MEVYPYGPQMHVQQKRCGAHVWEINWYVFDPLMCTLSGPFQSVRIHWKKHPEELLLVCLCQLANCISYSKFSSMVIISRVWKFFLDIVTNVSALQLAVHVYTCILVCWTRLVCGHIKSFGLESQIVEKLLKIRFVVNICLCVWEWCLTSYLVNN